MIRESLAAGSKQATMFVSAGKGLAFQRRADELTDWLDGTVIGNVYASRQMKQARLP